MLKVFAEIDLRKSQVVELRFFGGLSAEETAAVLESFSRHRPSRLEAGQGLAETRDEHGEIPVSARTAEKKATRNDALNVGERSKRSTTLRPRSATIGVPPI